MKTTLGGLAILFVSMTVLAQPAPEIPQPMLGKKPQDLIVGKWNATTDKNKGLTLEFTKDGDIKFAFSAEGFNQTFTGKYKFSDDKTLELTVTDPNDNAKSKTVKNPIKSLTDDELVIVDKDGKDDAFKRAK